MRRFKSIYTAGVLVSTVLLLAALSMGQTQGTGTNCAQMLPPNITDVLPPGTNLPGGNNMPGPGGTSTAPGIPPSNMPGMPAPDGTVGGIFDNVDFTQLDANGDGLLTLEEIHALIPQFPEDAFNRMDRNHDGFLDVEELFAALVATHRPVEPPQPMPDLGRILHIIELFLDADANHDMRLTLEEIQAVRPDFSEEKFNELDRNDDGVIDLHEALMPPPNEPASGNLLDLLRRADTDGDQRVTLEDIRAVAPDFPEDQFNRLDTNDDGVISPEDHPGETEPGTDPSVPPDPIDPMQILQRLIERLDENGDGGLSLDEIRQVLPEFPEDLFRNLDRNGDGLLNLADLPNMPVPVPEPGPSPLPWPVILITGFDEIDADGDGQLTLDEIQALFPGFPADLFTRLDENADGFLVMDELVRDEPQPVPPRTPQEIFEEADADGDGFVTLDDLRAVLPDFPEEAFNRLDTDDDGLLSLDEFLAGHPEPVPMPMSGGGDGTMGSM